MRNELSLLKMLINNNADIHINNDGILRLVAHEGYTELLIYLLLLQNCNANYNVLFNSTACPNNKNTQKVLNNYLIQC